MNLVRSAIAPEIIAATIEQNNNWRIQKGYPSKSPAAPKPVRKNPSEPNRPPFDSPNIRPKPIDQKANAPTEKPMRVFMITFDEFLARV